MTDTSPTRPKRLLLLLAAINFMNFYDRQLLAALAEPIKRHFALSDTQLGGLNSAFEIVYPFAALVLGMAADRWVRKYIIAIGVTVWSMATMATGAAGSYLALALTRAAVGLGCGGYGPAAMALISDAFPSSSRSRVVALHDVGLMLGSALGYLLGGLLGQALGWPSPFLIAGLPGLVLGVLAWKLREPRRGESEYETLGIDPRGVKRPARPSITLKAVRQLLTLRTLQVVYLADILIAFATGGLIFWLPSFMVRLHDYSLREAGILAGVLQVVTGLIGILIGAWVADKWTERHPGGRMLTLGAGFLIGTPLAVIAILTPNATLFGVAAGLAVIAYSVYFPCLTPQIHDVTPPELRSTALAINILLGHALGNSLSAPFIGMLSDLTGDLRYALLMVPAVALLGGLVALMGVRSAGDDRRRMLESLQNDA
jgi:MFS family permease